VPGHQLNRRHWISIRAGDAVTRELVENEVRESYRLVRSKLPSSGRTADGSKERRLASRQVQPFARKLAASMPGVSHGRPFVEKLDVYKVGDKVFLIVTDDPMSGSSR
jgi:predicted DNA-binding protein (MmcQ/YjbR family)